MISDCQGVTTVSDTESPAFVPPSPNWCAQAFALVGALLLCYAAAGVGGLLTAAGMRDGWYAQLAKPDWTPPDWVFGPVWTVLYTMMAVAAWLVWRQPNAPGRNVALVLFAIQLALNPFWSALFFAMHSPGAAFAEITLLWLAIAATALSFWRVSTMAFMLMLPYLVWVGFAGVLNWALWQLNCGAA
jgi:tryptophan-rich sensory protein